MTDEEMAEESFKRYRITDEDYEDLNGKEKLLVFNHEYGAEKQYRRLYKQGFLAGLKAGRPQWHKLSEKYPDADKLVRVRLMSGMEHICETCYYEPTEDEIGYGKLIINFYELDGEWVDDTDIIAWCELPVFDKE